MNKALILVTYNREDLLKKVIQSVDPTKFDAIIIVKDGGGNSYDVSVEQVLNERFVYLPQSENLGVGRCKQIGIDYVLSKYESEHIFIVEDDVAILDNSVWDYYIDFSKKSGIWHTNWNDFGSNLEKFEIDFEGIRGIVTKDVKGAFSYFHRNIFKFCEFPSDMKNAFEHISVELQLIEKNLLPPFWNFVCPKNSENYLKYLGEDSTITDKPNYSDNYQKSFKAFVLRHGKGISQIPDVETEEVLGKLKFLKQSYAKI